MSVPFGLLEPDGEDDEGDGYACMPAPAFGVGCDGMPPPLSLEFASLPTTPALEAGMATEGPPASQLMSSRLVHRLMQDAIALQLTRRGFDGLCQNALGVLAELATDFITALGAQLRMLPLQPPHAITHVVRLQQLVNVRSSREWAQLQQLFPRNSDNLSGAVSSQLQLHEAPTTGGPSPPASVHSLYSVMRGAWHVRQTPNGRVNHANAGAMETVPPDKVTSAAHVDVSELAESLRMNRRQRVQVEKWLNNTMQPSAHVLLPGLPINPDAPEPAKRRKSNAALAPAKGAQAAGMSQPPAPVSGSPGLLLPPVLSVASPG